MCYGTCPFETYMGECGIWGEEQKYLKEKFGFYCATPTCLEEENDPIFKEMEQALHDYRVSRAVMRKLSGKWY